MASYRTVCLCAIVSCALIVSVLGNTTAGKDSKVKGPPATQLNKVSSQCPHGAFFYRGCMSCVCEATMTAETRAQFPAHQLRVCAGEIPPDDCAQFTCAAAKNYMATTECEGKCTCDEATKITTCQRWPCPYE